MSRFAALLLLTGLLVAGCTKQVNGTPSEAAVEVQIPKTSITASGAETFRLPGSIVIYPELNEVLGNFKRSDLIECRGTASHHDLTYRALVTVTDDDGEIVGQDILGAGVFDERTRTCRMQFAVQVKEGNSAWYGVRIGDQQPFQIDSASARSVGVGKVIR